MTVKADARPSCDHCREGRHDVCDGFRGTLWDPESGTPCGCYLASPGELHPNTYAGKQAARTAKCRENGTHHPQSMGFGDYHCGTCGWVGGKTDA